MKYAGFSSNSRLVYVDEYSEFYFNVSSYLYFSSTARFLRIEFFEAELLPIDFYNYSVKDRALIEIVPVHPEHLISIQNLSKEISFIKSCVRLPNRRYMELYGTGGVQKYITDRIFEISQKILSNEQLTDIENELFNTQEKKYINVDRLSLARMIVENISLSRNLLDKSVIDFITLLDNNGIDF